MVGIGAAVSDGGKVPGASEHAVPLHSLEDARVLAGALRDVETNRLKDASYAPRVAVIGGGYSGCELAGVIAERLKGSAAADSARAEVHVFAGSRDGILPSAPSGQRESTVARLDRLGVRVMKGARATAVRPDDSESSGALDGPSSRCVLAWRSNDGDEHLSRYDIVCWTVGQQIECPSSWPFLRDARSGKITVDATLRAVGYEDVFAVGDVAAVVETGASGASSGSGWYGTAAAARPGDPGYETSSEASRASKPETHFASPPSRAPLPSTAQVAFQQADYAAWNVWSSVQDRPLLPFKYQHVGDMMTTGKADAAVALPVGDVTLDGIAGAALRRAAYLYRMPTDEHRMKLAAEWLKVGLENVAEKGVSKVLEEWGIEVPNEVKRVEKLFPKLPGF